MLTPAYPVSTPAATITVRSPGAIAAATSLPVNAITLALPLAFVLDFGTSHYAKLSAAAAINATTLAVQALPLALTTAMTATVPGNSAAYGNLSEAVRALVDSDRIALNVSAELVLDLTAGYTGVDAEQLAIAVAFQMNLMQELDVNAMRLKSVSPASPGPTRTFRDRWVDPRAAVIVAKVTGRKAVRFEPMEAGV